MMAAVASSLQATLAACLRYHNRTPREHPLRGTGGSAGRAASACTAHRKGLLFRPRKP